MQLTSTFFALLATTLSAIPAMAQSPSPSVLNFDTLFDEPTNTLSQTICSAGVGPLKGINTFGEIPSYPYIAGSFLVTNSDLSRCGACVELSFNRADGTQVTIPFTIVNSAPQGFTSSLQGAEDLTGFNRNNWPGNVPISFREVPGTRCGFN